MPGFQITCVLLYSSIAALAGAQAVVGAQIADTQTASTQTASMQTASSQRATMHTAIGGRPDTPGGEPALRVGTLTLHHCGPAAAWCGSLARPLDPSGRSRGTVSVYFEYFPHSNPGKREGTLVATEGGPGFPATDSRDQFLELFAPLRTTRDVVLMDNRGTGRSTAVDCPELQSAGLSEGAIARCGQLLGTEGLFYSGILAADDLAAILSSLGTGAIDLYGDSYGTFFEQLFAVRHPGQLRSLVLDGAYPLDGPDYAWYPNYAPAMRDKFNRVCERSAACRRIPGTSIEHVTPVLDALRRAPFSAKGLDANGHERRFRADAAQLATVMFGSAPAYATVRELDAAARVFLQGDRLPLLRLMAETQVDVDSRDETGSPAKFSGGLAATVMCEDAPQIYDMAIPPAQRIRERDRALEMRARTAPDTYAPFTLTEYRGMPLDYAFIDECASWPAVPRSHLDTLATIRHAAFPAVPALVISGDLDNMTPVADGALAARRFPLGRQLIVRNGLHVNALPHSRSPCPARIVQHFIESLDPGDTSCLSSVPEVRMFGAFARKMRELEAAVPLQGNTADEAGLRAATAAVLTVGDAIDRIESNTSGEAPGLRGGTISITPQSRGAHLALHRVRWTEDLSISGEVRWPGRDGPAQADLRLAGAGDLRGTLKIRWSEGITAARAEILGELAGGVTVHAQTAAP